ncbi:magnesium transporter MRS2-A, chloroplastic-like isoform X4 [Humulus lupulus]|uniref:magnesium transporter MRS2-A, chloroplastic-like isoform X4 n=1 Tax=Humulus lupulus TaxID=3486 RepID=UPI002B406BE5|nr:magnesium transporter MRS2-A, chloroplastic-like isoform X4 [Humulus lupulus]
MYAHGNYSCNELSLVATIEILECSVPVEQQIAEEEEEELEMLLENYLQRFAIISLVPGKTERELVGVKQEGKDAVLFLSMMVQVGTYNK